MICPKQLPCHRGAICCVTAGQEPSLKLNCSICVQLPVGINHPLGIAVRWSQGSLAEGEPVESNERYYRRRAVEERMAARRAISESARAWHAKLAEDFAERATACTGTAPCTQTAVAS
jgi:hypothetical protein